MFAELRQFSIPKLSAGILRWTFYTSRLMGAVGFRYKTTSTERVMMEDNPLMWKWLFAIIRLGSLSVYLYMYTQWKMPSSDLIEKVLQLNRAFLQSACCMSIVRLHLYQGPEVTQLVNSFLQLYRRVQSICNRNQNGFGGKDDLIFLVFMLICLIHEEIFLLRLIKPHWNALKLAVGVKTKAVIFGVFHKMSVPKLSAGILRFIFRYAQFIGVFFFRLKKSKEGEKVSNCKWLKWMGVTHRFITFCIFLYSYSWNIILASHRGEQVLHILRILLSIPIILFLLGYQVLRGPEIIELFNKFFRLFWQVSHLFKPKTIGFGGRRELILILLNLVCLFHELTYIWITVKNISTWHFAIYWWCDVFVVTGTNMFIHINVMAFLSIGVLYSEVNRYVRTHLRTQLQNLDTSASEQQIRKLKNRLEKCTYLYREIYQINTGFQRLFVMPLFLALINKVLLVVTIGLKMITDLNFCGCVFWILIGKHILDLLLLTTSVQGALNQFRIIRRPNLEIPKAEDLKEFRRMLEIFYTHLNLCQFRVSILGLCEITNELFLMILSAVVTWLAFIAQYRMQIKIEKNLFA
ncbi:putative gustatory receptor 92a [Drosophila takahashii]|uniref:putative gustatory receptor 92a n=1 Tax=Drosophila takahashii TaxID=29030 RepID=UPI00389928BB